MTTIIDLFEEKVNEFHNNSLLWEKKTDIYESLNYSEVREKVRILAAGLLNLKIKKGDRIALLSEGRNYWVISELAILYTGAINVPLSVKLDAGSELKFRLEHSGTKMLFVSGSQSKKIKQIKNNLPDLELIIYLDPQEEYESDEISIDEVFLLGENYLKTNNKDVEDAFKAVVPADLANISYTSGTTADPKGIMLTHRNYTANVEQACSLMYIPEHYKTLLILPLDHSFAHTAGIYSFIAYGASIAFVQAGKTTMETLKNIPVNIKEIKPNILLSVPALAINFKKNIEKGISEKGPKAEKLLNSALKIAYSYNKDGYNKGKGIHIIKKPLLKLFDKILFSKIRAGFGGGLDFFIGGGALLDIEIQRFFYAIGMPMFQGYGLSETSPIISSNSKTKHKLGSSGYLVKNIELKIVDEKNNELPVEQKGEIIVKGENVMVGYWKNEKATAEAIKDGWLYTGDMGYMDKDGFLYVLGRFKSLLIANDGEKYSPEAIEETLVQHSKYIDQCMLYNNQNPYTVGLIVPNKEALRKYLKENNLNFETDKGQELALKKIQSEIDEYKKGGKFEGMFTERWLPAAIAILGESFSEENRMINSTLKMVRGKIVEFYKIRIDNLFQPDAKDVCNHQNKNIVSKF
ncbi:MAG: long-chain fatty acid--CoA ligase [Bacteroidetes bacterium GWA2_31_9b]|nr:MAG: long-chain fatty acid--CoA ligase [Bacteroidetes bacterium GWA2_31_9b]